jgi:hypothetical protein
MTRLQMNLIADFLLPLYNLDFILTNQNFVLAKLYLDILSQQFFPETLVLK